MSIAEISPQHHFAGNMTASAVLTLGEVLTMLDPSPSSPETVTSCHDYPLISSAPDSGCRYEYTHLLLVEYKIYAINCSATVVKLEMRGDSEGLLHSWLKFKCEPAQMERQPVPQMSEQFLNLGPSENSTIWILCLSKNISMLSIWWGLWHPSICL